MYILHGQVFVMVSEKQIIHFCQESSVTGKSINIIFDGNRKSALDTPTECSCVLVPPSGKVQYTVNAPDIRLMTRGGNCDSEAKLSGFGDVNISCSAKWENWTSTRVMLGERQFRLGFKARPEFIWIRVEVYGKWYRIFVNWVGEKELSLNGCL